MRPSDRRIVASALVGGVVGGFATGESTSWAANLATLAIWGAFAGVTTWIVLEGVALVIRGRR